MIQRKKIKIEKDFYIYELPENSKWEGLKIYVIGNGKPPSKYKHSYLPFKISLKKNFS